MKSKSCGASDVSECDANDQVMQRLQREKSTLMMTGLMSKCEMMTTTTTTMMMMMMVLVMMMMNVGALTITVILVRWSCNWRSESGTNFLALRG